MTRCPLRATIEGTTTIVQGQWFEDMAVGDTFVTGARTVTETDLVGFVSAYGFVEPLFLDARAAAEAGYAGRLVPGALTFALAEGLVIQTGVIHGTGLAFLGAEMRAVGPVFVGDTIHVTVEVTEVRASRTAGRGVVTTMNRVRNQDDQEVLTYAPVRLVRGRDG